MTIVNLSGHEMTVLLSSLAASYLLALPLGWERKAESEAQVGLRVFPLVAVSSCAYVFLGQQLFAGEFSAEQSDVLQGLMTGIGFIGAGAIVKSVKRPTESRPRQRCGRPAASEPRSRMATTASRRRCPPSACSS